MDLLSFNFKYYEDWSYFNLFVFGGRGGLDKPALACLGLLSLSFSLVSLPQSRYRTPVKSTGFNFYEIQHVLKKIGPESRLICLGPVRHVVSQARAPHCVAQLDDLSAGPCCGQIDSNDGLTLESVV